MEVEPAQNEVYSGKRNMSNVDEWLRRSKQIKNTSHSVNRKALQESSYNMSMMLHYNTDIVIGGYTGMFISVTERESSKWRIVVNGSGSGVEDDTFVIMKATDPSANGIIQNGDVVCIRHKKYRQYLSCNAESGEIGLCARVSSDSEKWVIYNDFLEGASSDIESGCCVVLKRLTGQYLTDSHERSHDGVLKLTGSNNDTLIVEPQIWRIMKSHASFLELNPASIAHEQIINPTTNEMVDIRSLPFQVQSSMITEEFRLALFLAPGRLFHFKRFDHPLIPNRRLLVEMSIDYSKAEEYLCWGCEMNDRYQMDGNLKNLLKVMLPNLNQVLRIKSFIRQNNRFEFGRVITSVIHLITENITTFDKVVSELSQSITLSNLHLVLLYWSNQLEVMDNLCRLCSIIRGGQLLNQLILLEENESNEQKKQFYRDVLDVACREYFEMMQDYIYKGEVNDYYNEFMIIHVEEVRKYNTIATEFIFNPVHELSAINTSSAKILLCGYYINIVNNTGKTVENPCYKQWSFDYDVTVYGANIEEAFSYANQLLLGVLRSDEYNITNVICNLNRLFLLLRGDLCIYLYDHLNTYLSQEVASIDLVRMQSLVQVCLMSVFNDGRPATQQFIDSVTVGKGITRSDRDKGWDVLDLGIGLKYPLTIIITDAILRKYRNIFHLLLMLNNTCRSLDNCWCVLNQCKQTTLQKMLYSARCLQNNLKYFINTLLYYLNTDIIVPSASQFETELPQYATVEAFEKGFNDFVGGVYEKCFLGSDHLIRALRAICSTCNVFVDYVDEQLHLGNTIGRRKTDRMMEEESTQEEDHPTPLRAIAVINQEVGTRLRSRISHIEEVTSSVEWKEKMRQVGELFEAQKNDFLNALEMQPGFLQSTFLGLHRKLRERYL